MGDCVIRLDDVSMRFILQREKTEYLKEYAIKLAKRQNNYNEFYALKNICIEIEKGDSVALIGANGSGKSTLLKIIAGIYRQTSGQVKVTGTISPLIELGAGFDLDLTAGENVYLNGLIMGHSKKFMKEKFQEVIDFAELWDFVDVPVKNFSSGMTARLGFAIATIVKPDILIVDEILSVGDANFQKKCEKKMNELLKGSTTLIMVSHSDLQVRENCKKAIWLNKGELIEAGEVNAVCDKYLRG